MYKKATLLLLAVSFFSKTIAAEAEITIGVNAPRGELATLEQWTEVANTLSNKIGETVTVVPLKPKDMVPAAMQGRVDFFLSNPVQTIVITETGLGTPLASLEKNAGKYFAGVIATKKGNGITKVEHLKGRRIMAKTAKSAAGARVFQEYHIQQQGVKLAEDGITLINSKKQDDAILAVAVGIMDAAFVRSGVLESMSKAGKIDLEEFFIIDHQHNKTTDCQRDKSFNLLHSTRLYPEWYLLSAKATNAKTASKLKDAALSILPDSSAAQTAKIKGFFTPPLSMEPLKEALKALNLPPFTKEEQTPSENLKSPL